MPRAGFYRYPHPEDYEENQNERYAEKAVKVHCKLCGNKFDYCDVCSEPDKIRQLMKEDKI